MAMPDVASRERALEMQALRVRMALCVKMLTNAGYAMIGGTFFRPSRSNASFRRRAGYGPARAWRRSPSPSLLRRTARRMTDVLAFSAFDAVMLAIALTALGLLFYLVASTRRLTALRRLSEELTTSAETRAEAERLLRLAGELSRNASAQVSLGSMDELR